MDKPTGYNDLEKSMNPSQEPIIGTLNEHTLHLALKHYCEPNAVYHEIPCMGFVADILRGGEIVEIETRSFANVKRKLDAFLEEHTVTVVYPIAVRKWVIWIDPATGALSEKHRSPKKGRSLDVVYELYKLLPYLTHPRFRLKLILCEVEEYKRRDGWSHDGKRGATREERIPIGFLGEQTFACPADYERLADVIPDGEFTAAAFAKANKLKGRYPWYALKILTAVGIVEQCGQRGRAFLYRRCERS